MKKMNEDLENDDFEYADIVIQMHDLEMSMIPSDEELRERYVLSEEFYARMERLIKRMSRRERRGIRLRYAVAIVVVLLTLYGLSNSQYVIQAYERIMDWFTDHVVIHFQDEVELEELPEYELGYVPEGYVLESASHSEMSGGAIYVCGDRRLMFNYCKSDSITSLDNSGKDYYYLVTESGRTVYYFEGTGGKSSSMVWQSEDGSVCFWLDGNLSQEELLEILEHVTEKN